MKKSIRRILGITLFGVMLASTIPSFAAPQHGKAKKGGKSGKGSQKKGGKGSSK